MAESEYINNFTSSMKPFFLRAVPNKKTFKGFKEVSVNSQNPECINYFLNKN